VFTNLKLGKGFSEAQKVYFDLKIKQTFFQKFISLTQKYNCYSPNSRFRAVGRRNNRILPGDLGLLLGQFLFYSK